jgi:tetratricopeptide (TPR) repeat protein
LARPLRYNFIVGLVALSAGLAAAGGWRYARASAPVSGPIILISVDSLRADRLPVYGYKNVRTPAIDRLAADGIVFERAYSHSPQTLPAHTSLLSGRLPFQTGVRGTPGFTVKDEERLLAEMLRDRGYTTGAVVSTFELRKESGIGQGFAFFDDQLSPAAPAAAVGGVTREGAASEEAAERWLSSAGTERAFLFLHLQEPHKPHGAPSRFAEYSTYDAEVAHADEIVGNFFQYLKAHQLYDQSTIFFLADHGEGLGDHGEQEHGLLLHEEALRVPLIIKQAAGQGAGRRVPDLVQHVDLVPTILDLAKAPIPGNIEGRSLKPLLEDTGRLRGRLVYSESLYGHYLLGLGPLSAITDGRFRYIRGPREALYDVQQDPGERHNLIDDPTQAPTLAALRTRLNDLIADASVPAPADTTPDEKERFEALGYVGEFGARPAVSTAGEPIDPSDQVVMVEIYREAIDLAVARRWTSAIERLRSILTSDPSRADVWRHIALLSTKAERPAQALDAYKHVVALRPDDASAYLAQANTLLQLRRLDEAWKQAQLGEAVALVTDSRWSAPAHELLSSIALARRDAASAREQARLAKQADMQSPLPLYVEARLLYDRGQYDGALPLFEQTIEELDRNGGRAIQGLHFYAADTMKRLGHDDADIERELVRELEGFPRNIRARADLATLYHETGRLADAAGAIADLIRVSPTPDAYSTAASLLASFGNRQQASVIGQEAVRLAYEQ